MNIPSELVYEIIELLKLSDEENATEVLFTLQELVSIKQAQPMRSRFRGL